MFSCKTNWSESEMRTKIFGVVNSVMKGRWAETAMQETGSIICQNIFESADVEEKVEREEEGGERVCCDADSASRTERLRVRDPGQALRVCCQSVGRVGRSGEGGGEQS